MLTRVVAGDVKAQEGLGLGLVLEWYPIVHNDQPYYSRIRKKVEDILRLFPDNYEYCSKISHKELNSRKGVTWSAVPVAPAFTFFWLWEGKLGQWPRKGQ